MSFASASLYALLVAPMLLLALGLTAGRGPAGRARASRWTWLAHALAVVAATVLAVTALSAVWRDQGMNGWSLLIHAGVAAPLYLVALLWTTAWETGLSRAAHGPAPISLFRKLVFGLYTTAALLTAGTMLFSMLPLFGYDLLVWSIEVHRWSGLALLVLLMGYLYALWARR